MIKSEKGLGAIGIIIFICLIIFVVAFITYLLKSNVSKEKNADIKANMLLIQGACKVKKQKTILEKNDDALVGTKLSEAEDNAIIENFKSLGILGESEYDRYYILTDDNLQELEVEVKNEKDSYYLVNYDTSDVIITKGYLGEYKLADIENDD